MYIFKASSNYATIIQCHFGRVKKVDDASKITLKYSSLLRRRAKHVHNNNNNNNNIFGLNTSN